MTLMQVYLRLLLFLLYVTDEGLLNIIIIRVVCHWLSNTSDYYCSWCMSLMKLYLRLLLFLLCDTNAGLLKIITVVVVCHWWRST
jgi:hypothetical protein